MKRRNFLKSLAAVAVVPLAAAEAAALTTSSAKPKDQRIFYAENAIEFDKSNTNGNAFSSVNLDIYENATTSFGDGEDPKEFTKKLVSLAKKVMEKQVEAQNKLSEKTKKATDAVEYLSKSLDDYDLYISPERLDDIRNWGVDHIDEQTKKEIFNCDESHKQMFFVSCEIGSAILDNRHLLIADFS